jgi:hypothetical protein
MKLLRYQAVAFARGLFAQEHVDIKSSTLSPGERVAEATAVAEAE